MLTVWFGSIVKYRDEKLFNLMTDYGPIFASGPSRTIKVKRRRRYSCKPIYTCAKVLLRADNQLCGTELLCNHMFS